MYGLLLALAAAALFGASAPASKLLLQSFDAVQLAGLLYLGAAVAMVPAVIRERSRVGRAGLDRVNQARLAAVVILGGVIAPISLLGALQLASAGAVSLLLNFELITTAVLGVLLFHEHLSRGAWLAVAGVAGASALLSGESGSAGWAATLLVLAACICWGIDNQLSALIDGMTPARSTLWKGTVAGATNLMIGFTVGPLRATAPAIVMAIMVGAISYGVSIALHTAAAQRVGAVRAQGVFASAPFIGAALSVLLLRETVTGGQAFAAIVFLISVVGFVINQHEHAHSHRGIEHLHAHTHDDGHHQHEHPDPVAMPHTHWHRHDAVVHAHPHWPDLHHRHSHARPDSDVTAPG